MLKNKSRIWNSVRPLRGKKDTLSDGLSSAKSEEFELDSELKKRVRQWLSESSLPTDTSSQTSCNLHQKQERYFDASQCSHGVEKADAGVLYHPDFADWTSIHPMHDDRTPSPENLRADDFLQVLDDATASLSKLLSAPFG
jgi:hypothetical protein